MVRMPDSTGDEVSRRQPREAEEVLYSEGLRSARSSNQLRGRQFGELAEIELNAMQYITHSSFRIAYCCRWYLALYGLQTGGVVSGQGKRFMPAMVW